MERRCNNSEASSTESYEMTNAIADSRTTDYGTIITNGKRSGDWNKSYLKNLSFGLCMRLNTFIICMSIAYFELNIPQCEWAHVIHCCSAQHWKFQSEMPYQFSAKKTPNYTDCIAPANIPHIFLHSIFRRLFTNVQCKPPQQRKAHKQRLFPFGIIYIFTLSRVCCSLREFMQHLHSIILENGLTAHGERFLYTRPIFSRSTWFVLLYWLWRCIRSFCSCCMIL